MGTFTPVLMWAIGAASEPLSEEEDLLPLGHFLRHTNSFWGAQEGEAYGQSLPGGEKWV